MNNNNGIDVGMNNIDVIDILQNIHNIEKSSNMNSSQGIDSTNIAKIPVNKPPAKYAVDVGNPA